MGFLSSMLPMVAGAALASTGIGAPAAAALIGGAQYARTGSLNKGLMAGLGAYGGAGIGQGLMTAGNSAISNAAAAANPSFVGPMPGAASGIDAMQSGISALSEPAGRSAFMSGVGGGKGLAMSGLAAAAPMMAQEPQMPQTQPGDSTMPQRLRYEQGTASPFPKMDVPGYDNLGQDFGRQRSYFPNAGYVPISQEEAKAERGYASGGPVEQMSNAAAIGENTGYPQADITGHAYATPWQTPVSQNVVQGSADTGVNRMSGQMLAGGGMANGGLNLAGKYSRDLPSDLDNAYAKAERVDDKPVMRGIRQEQGLRERLRNPQMHAAGGLSHLGDYSDGGRLLKGPGDGVSDSIPAVIGKKQPARLADGEFVVPARIVSELGNGSTEAGARKLYAMMDRVQSARGKTVGKGKVAKNSRADKYLPA